MRLQNFITCNFVAHLLQRPYATFWAQKKYHVVNDPRQVDFPAGHLTFPSKSFFTCLMAGQGPRKDSKLRLTQGEQNLRAACLKGELKLNFFSAVNFRYVEMPMATVVALF